MRLIDLISKLQALYNTYDAEYKEVMGEPEIVIDCFDRIGDTHTFEYAGYDTNIVIEKTDCGLYDILNRFGNETNTKSVETKKPLQPYPPEDCEAQVEREKGETQ